MWVSLFTSQAALCTLPITVLVIISSLDSADKQLLASSFPMLSTTLGLSVETLGYFSLFTNISYALSLPLWGALVHHYGIGKVHILLAAACFSWGLSTMGIAAVGHSVAGQALFRALVGVALGSIMPLSQTLLVEMTPQEMRGRAFGLMLLCEKLAGTLAAAAVVYLDVWEIPYYVLGVASMMMGYLSWSMLSPSRRISVQIPSTREYSPTFSSLTKSSFGFSKKEHPPEVPQLTLRQIIHRIVQMPAFLCMVAQGVFGGTPWDMMSFLLLLMDWRGFTKTQIVTIQFSSGLTSTVGGWFGGFLGDYMAGRWGTNGRIWLAFGSVVGGIPLYGLHLFATDYSWALLWINAFQLWGTWTQSGALRPICADLTRNTSERAQIISLWIVLEKMSGALFGAPLVGYLTNTMLTAAASSNTTNDMSPIHDKMESTTGSLTASEKAQALAFNLLLLSTLFWGICAFFWAVMSVVIHRTQDEEPLSISQPGPTTKMIVEYELAPHSSSPESFGIRKRPSIDTSVGRGEKPTELQLLIT